MAAEFDAGTAVFSFVGRLQPAFADSIKDISGSLSKLQNNVVTSMSAFNAQRGVVADLSTQLAGAQLKVSQYGAGLLLARDKLDEAKLAHTKLTSSLNLTAAATDPKFMLNYSKAVAESQRQVGTAARAVGGWTSVQKQAQAEVVRLDGSLNAANATLRVYQSNVAQANQEAMAAGQQVSSWLAQSIGLNAALAVSAATIAALGAVIGLSTIKAAQFEYEMSRVTSVALDAAPAFAALGNEVLRISAAYGVSSTEVAHALKTIVVSQFTASESAKILEASTKLARAGFAPLKASADLVTTTIRAFGLSASDVDRVVNVLLKTVARSKIDLAELAPQFGRLASTADQLGLSLEETAAIYATLANVGMRAGVTTTSLGGFMRDFLVPSTEAAKAAWKDFGIVLDANYLRTHGLAGILKVLTGATETQITQIFGQIRAQRLILALKHEDAAATKNLAFMQDKTVVTGKMLDEVLSKLKATYEKLIKGLERVAILFGQAFLVVGPLKALGGIVERLGKILEDTANRTGIAWAVIASAVGTAVMAIVNGCRVAALALTKLIGNAVAAGMVFKTVFTQALLPLLGIQLAAAAVGYAIAALIAHMQRFDRAAEAAARAREAVDEQAKSVYELGAKYEEAAEKADVLAMKLYAKDLQEAAVKAGIALSDQSGRQLATNELIAAMQEKQREAIRDQLAAELKRQAALAHEVFLQESTLKYYKETGAHERVMANAATELEKVRKKEAESMARIRGFMLDIGKVGKASTEEELKKAATAKAAAAAAGEAGEIERRKVDTLKVQNVLRRGAYAEIKALGKGQLAVLDEVLEGERKHEEIRRNILRSTKSEGDVATAVAMRHAEIRESLLKNIREAAKLQAVDPSREHQATLSLAVSTYERMNASLNASYAAEVRIGEQLKKIKDAKDDLSLADDELKYGLSLQLDLAKMLGKKADEADAKRMEFAAKINELLKTQVDFAEKIAKLEEEALDAKDAAADKLREQVGRYEQIAKLLGEAVNKLKLSEESTVRLAVKIAELGRRVELVTIKARIGEAAKGAIEGLEKTGKLTSEQATQYKAMADWYAKRMSLYAAIAKLETEITKEKDKGAKKDEAKIEAMETELDYLKIQRVVLKELGVTIERKIASSLMLGVREMDLLSRGMRAAVFAPEITVETATERLMKETAGNTGKTVLELKDVKDELRGLAKKFVLGYG